MIGTLTLCSAVGALCHLGSALVSDSVLRTLLSSPRVEYENGVFFSLSVAGVGQWLVVCRCRWGPL